MANGSEKDTAIKKFIRENKSLAFMLPVLVVLVIILIIVYSGVFKNDANIPINSQSQPNPPLEALDENQPKVEVLPQIIRSENESGTEITKDPFEAPMKLRGVIISQERSTAIIESGDTTYILKLNDTIGKSQWRVTEIQSKFVTIESGGERITLELTTEPNIQEQ